MSPSATRAACLLLLLGATTAARVRKEREGRAGVFVGSMIKESKRLEEENRASTVGIMYVARENGGELHSILSSLRSIVVDQAIRLLIRTKANEEDLLLLLKTFEHLFIFLFPFLPSSLHPTSSIIILFLTPTHTLSAFNPRQLCLSLPLRITNNPPGCILTGVQVPLPQHPTGKPTYDLLPRVK